MERNIYTPRPFMGLLSMMAVDVLLFGIGWGLIAWTCMAVWIPIFGNVINGIGHAIGYRNFETKDSSRNILPIGLWIVGEELHNNHHADPKSAKFKAKWYEFDIGWMYISLLKAFRLANVIYARNVSAKEFKAKYYGKATVAAAEVGASATAAARVAQVAARRAQVAASEAVNEAARRAQIAGAAITSQTQDAIAE
jgi:stearoyl-CoA desaturase (delta-9 desaturase)